MDKKKITLKKKKSYKIKAELQPITASDKVTFTSSNKKSSYCKCKRSGESQESRNSEDYGQSRKEESDRNSKSKIKSCGGLCKCANERIPRRHALATSHWQRYVSDQNTVAKYRPCSSTFLGIVHFAHCPKFLAGQGHLCRKIFPAGIR